MERVTAAPPTPSLQRRPPWRLIARLRLAWCMFREGWGRGVRTPPEGRLNARLASSEISAAGASVPVRGTRTGSTTRAAGEWDGVKSLGAVMGEGQMRPPSLCVWASGHPAPESAARAEEPQNGERFDGLVRVQVLAATGAGVRGC